MSPVADEVERVARAICSANLGLAWDTLSETARETYRSLARAAIAALPKRGAMQPHKHGPECFDHGVHLCGMETGSPEPAAHPTTPAQGEADEADHEWECARAHDYLDEIGAPRSNASGKVYSLAGRMTVAALTRAEGGGG